MWFGVEVGCVRYLNAPIRVEQHEDESLFASGARKNIYNCLLYREKTQDVKFSGSFSLLHFWSVLAKKCPTSAGWDSVEYIVIQSLVRHY